MTSLIDKAVNQIWERIPESRRTIFSFIVLFLFLALIIFSYFSKHYLIAGDNLLYAPQTMIDSPFGIQVQGDYIGSIDRHLTNEDIEKLKIELAKNQFKKDDVTTIVSAGEESEKINLANEIKDWLEKEGYKTEGVNISFGTEYGGRQIKGVLILKEDQRIIIGHK